MSWILPDIVLTDPAMMSAIRIIQLSLLTLNLSYTLRAVQEVTTATSTAIATILHRLLAPNLSYTLRAAREAVTAVTAAIAIFP